MSAALRAVLGRHCELRPQPEGDWTGPFPLPAQVAAFYAEIGPVDGAFPTRFGTLQVPSLIGLWEFQDPYRHKGDPDVPSEDWDDDWLLLATVEGNPYVLSLATGAILSGDHEMPGWDMDEAYDTIAEMLADLVDDDDDEKGPDPNEIALLRLVPVPPADIAAACAAMSVPQPLKRAWFEHGQGACDTNIRGALVHGEIRRLLPPGEVRALVESDPDRYREGVPFFEKGAGLYASVGSNGIVRLPDGTRFTGSVEIFLLSMFYGPDH